MPSIYDFANAEEIASYYKEKQSNSIPYLGRALFPRQKQLGLDLKWIKGAGGLPVALTPSNFDTKPTLRDRIGFSEIETEMPFFRESMRIGEKDRQDINNLMAARNSELIQPMLRNIFDDAAGLVNGAEVQAERMRMQLISTFGVSIEANRKAYTYDYDPNDDLTNHKETLTGTDMWSDTANSSPVEDIQSAQDTIEEETGERPTRAVCTRKTWNYLIQNESIRGDIIANGYASGGTLIMTDEIMRNYLSNKLGLTVTVYNKKYSKTVKNQSGNLFFPDDVFSLLPTGTLGNTYYGTTPEESDLMTGNSNADVQIVDTGIAVTTELETTPVNVKTTVSGIVLPSFERIDQVYVLNVHTA